MCLLSSLDYELVIKAIEEKLYQLDLNKTCYDEDTSFEIFKYLQLLSWIKLKYQLTQSINNK